jgi:pimeloyl-ACP methyl ester carboxylesterase
MFQLTGRESQQPPAQKMQRPSLQPGRVTPPSRPDDDEVEAVDPRFLSGFGRALLRNPFSRRGNFAVYEGSRLERFIRGLLYRLALLPAVAILSAAAMVYLQTHPSSPQFVPDPLTQGVYYEPLTLMADDHVRIEAWLAPALDAEQVINEGEKVLKHRWPAVILAHGFGMTRQQVLPLFRPLHDKGYVVMAIAMRGGGTLDSAGQTFGINEALDIKAAVLLLRRRPFVDSSRIAIVGVGSGANAAILAADHDPSLAALVLDAPAPNGNEAFDAHINNTYSGLRVLNPLCRLAFQIGYGLTVSDLDMDRYGAVLAARPTLLMRWSADAESDLPAARVDQIVDFLGASLDKPTEQADVEP